MNDTRTKDGLKFLQHSDTKLETYFTVSFLILF